MPGVVGIAGGLTTTVADAIRDRQSEGKINMGNLAANLGFTALAAVGLGGLGAAAKAAKAAKLAKPVIQGEKMLSTLAKSTGTAEKVVKEAGELITKTTDDLNKLGRTGNVEGWKKRLESLDQLKQKLTTTVKDITDKHDLAYLAKNAGKTPTGNKGNIIDKSHEVLSKLNKAKSDIAQIERVTETMTKEIAAVAPNVAKKKEFLEVLKTQEALKAKNTKILEIGKKRSEGLTKKVNEIKKNLPKPKEQGEFAQYLQNKGIGKVGKGVGTAMKVAAMAPAALSVPAVIGDISEGGVGNIQQSDLKNIAFGAAAAKRFFMEKRLATDIKNLTNKTVTKEATEGGIKIGSKEYKGLSAPKKSGRMTLHGGEKDKKTLEEFNKLLKEKDANAPEVKSFDEIRAFVGTKATEVNSGIKSLKQSGLNPKRYERLMRIINGKKPIKDYFNINAFPRTVSHKQGGTLKFQVGGALNEKAVTNTGLNID